MLILISILWIRNNFSTAISLFIDTFIVIGIMSLFNIFPFDQFRSSCT
ncbi:hypothetical protein [Rickettsia massiliae]